MTPEQSERLLLLLAALVLPTAALMRGRWRGSSTGKLALLWLLVIAAAWLVASRAPLLFVYFT